MKRLLAPLAALLALLLMAFGRRPRRGQTPPPPDSAAKRDAIQARGDLEKERIDNDHAGEIDRINSEADRKRAEIDGRSDAGSHAVAEEYARRYRNSGGQHLDPGD